MPVFLLQPVVETSSDPDWTASHYVGQALVLAPDEAAARRYASGAFCSAVATGQHEARRSPWLQPRLVSVALAPVSLDGPTGMVLAVEPGRPLRPVSLGASMG